MITIKFKFTHEDQLFQDAVVFPVEHTLTVAEIEAIKLKRFNYWKDPA